MSKKVAGTANQTTVEAEKGAARYDVVIGGGKGFTEKRMK